MSQEEKHLSVEQIEALIETQLHATEALVFEESRRHLAVCEACRRLVSVHEERDRILRSLRAGAPTDITANCPSDNSLYELAGGVLESKEADEVLKHATECDHCGPVLRRAAELFNDPVLPEEEGLIRSLKSSRSSWQAGLARRLARKDVRDLEKKSLKGSVWSMPLRWTVGLASVAAVVAGALVVTWTVHRSQPVHAENLLARAYSERRTMELRIAGAEFAPLRVTRGGGESNIARPASLLEAEALIGKSLEKYPGNEGWLRAKGTADLLDGNYDSAIDSLVRVLRVDPDSTRAATDLASAYFLRGASTGRAIDFGAAMDLLGKGLARSPDEPVMLFNRAIISERMFLYVQAIDDWEHYLRVDPNGPWAAEAHKRLVALQEKLRRRDESLAQPLLEPDRLARKDPSDSVFRASIKPRLEEYLQLAVREWLPRAYPVVTSNTLARNDIRAALSALANVAYAENHDRWLTDLLASTTASRFPLAVAALSETVKANDSGDYLAARTNAMRARHLFEEAGSTAGALRSDLERIYSLHLSHEGALCLKAAAAKTNLSLEAYPWLNLQLQIEAAICQGLMGNLGEAQTILKDAVTSAHDSGYPTLYLRAVGNAAEMESGSGNLNAGWDRASSGLAFFWSAPIRPMQGYNLYVRLCSMAQEQRHRYLEVSIWRQALSLIDTDEDYLLRAMAHSMMASAALGAQMQNLASQKFNEADRLFLAAPQTRATANDRIEAGTTLAAVQARAGRLKEALALLQSLGPAMLRLSNHYVAIQFYATLGEVERRLGNDSEAEQALRSAVALSELSLESLRSESDRVTWSQLTSNTYGNLVQLRLHAGDATGALELWEWYRGAALRAGKKNAALLGSWQYSRMGARLEPSALSEGPTLPSLQEVSHALPTLENQTVVSYALFSDELALWIFDNRGIESRLLKKPSAEVDALVSRFEDLCSDPKSDLNNIENASRAMYEILIAPIEHKLSPQRTLIVETEKSLDRVPLNLLMDGQGRYLADKMPVVVSLGFYYNERRRPAGTISPRSAALIVGVALPSDRNLGHFNLVTEAESEAEEVARNFNAPRLLRGGQGTFRRVRQELPKAEVFHFAGHAVAAASESGLVLSDRILSADLLDDSPIQDLRLVVLSACDTQRGSAGRNDDSDSLVRMFARKGVPDVVASRWNVDSSATARFMETFYSNLISGKRVPESLREAQVSLRARPETSHPYYWGAFTAFAAK